jgi:thiamine kinase-like enzyme
VNGLEDRLARIVGAQPVEWTPRAGGYSTAERYTVTLEDGRRVFVKSAEAQHMAGWLRREHEVYASLRGSFIAELVGFDDDGVRPLLVTEDLSHADWSRRWTAARVDAVRTALDELHASAPPPNTTLLRESHPQLLGRWRDVADDPAPFLSAGVRSREWLDAHLHTVIDAADSARVDGGDVMHLDVRSDNLCTLDGRAVLVDWNWLCLGNGDLDLAAWLPSLFLEGGPAPWEVLPEAGPLAALISGVWAAVVGLPPPETAPAVRAFQQQQLAVTLDWLERDLL